MNSKVKILFIVGLIVYIGFFWYFLRKLNFNDLIMVIREGNLFYLFLAGISGLAMIFIQATLLKAVFNLYEIKLSIKESIGLWLMAVSSGAFTGGITGPAIYFYKAQKAKDTKTATKVTATFMMFYLLPNLLFVLIAGYLLLPTNYLISQSKNYLLNNLNIIYFVVIALLIVAAILVISKAKAHNDPKNIFWRKLHDFFSQFDRSFFTVITPSKAVYLFLISTIEIFFAFLIFRFALSAFSIDLSLAGSLKNFVIFEILSLFSPSGSGLGFVEIGLTGSLIITGLTSTEAFLTVLAYRLFNFWMPFVLGGIVMILKYKKLLDIIDPGKEKN